MYRCNTAAHGAATNSSAATLRDRPRQQIEMVNRHLKAGQLRIVRVRG